MTNLPCPTHLPPFVAQVCDPTCSRWARINRGDPVLVYVDETDFDNSGFVFTTNPLFAFGGRNNWVQFTTAMTGWNYTQLTSLAMDIWNEAHECEVLFELTSDPSLAHIRAEIILGAPGELEFGGRITAIVEPEDQPVTACSVNAAQEQAFSAGTPQLLQMRLVVDNGQYQPISMQGFVAILIHEFGHALGMAHQYNVPEASIMGNQFGSDGDFFARPSPMDIDHLYGRYPCRDENGTRCASVNETLGNNSAPVPAIYTTDTTCPVCNGQTGLEEVVRRYEQRLQDAPDYAPRRPDPEE